MNICIIGAGTYGSYIINSLQKISPNIKITLFDVGDSSIKSENEIGYFSSLKQSIYSGLTNGRWFGLGGTSTKWGGQLLTFTQNDFSNPSSFIRDIIQLNEQYKRSILEKFKIENDFKEKELANGLFTKTGVWLSFFRRDLFKHFKINKRKNIHIITNARVTRLVMENGKKITKVFFKQNGIEKHSEFDFYFLCAGAFECARILLNSNLLSSDKVMFSDHISQKVFKIKNGTMIGNEDLAFKVLGTSLVTKRFIGEVDGYSFYSHPVLNTDFPFFQSLKILIFKRQFSFSALLHLFSNVPQAIAFIYSVLIKRKMYVYKNEWYLYIDIENPTKTSYVMLSKETDKFGEPGLDVYYSIGEDANNIFSKSKELVKQYLIKCKIDFEECSELINIQNSEDIYHPYGMFSNFNSVEDFFNCYENMLVVSTGILPRAGGINPTAAVFPIVDEFINNHLVYKN
jgi:hypothetical protein